MSSKIIDKANLKRMLKMEVNKIMSVTYVSKKNLNDILLKKEDLTDIIFMEDIDELPRKAFYKCSKLKTIEFLKECLIKEIPNYAFAGCKNLISVKLSNKIKKI